MAKKLYEESNIRAIAEAIRAKNGKTETYTTAQMAGAIADITAGGGDADAIMRGIGEDTITNIVILHGTTKIARYAFANKNIESVTMPDSVTEIGMYAFANCEQLESIVLSNGLVKIDSNAFTGCDILAISSFPSGVTICNTYALAYNATETFTFHAGIQKVLAGFLSNAPNLKTVTFEGTPTTLATNIFSNCAALTDIYVPWAAGTDANESTKWGATNATIHYNYKG